MICARIGLTAEIVPALVDGAFMPGPEDLPTSMTPLASRQAVETSATREQHGSYAARCGWTLRLGV